jgi:Inosine-uridine preferring nucleoside hydrolase
MSLSDPCFSFVGVFVFVLVATHVVLNPVSIRTWYGAWGDLAKHTSAQSYHAPFVMPLLPEGNPTTKPLDEDAAHLLIREVRAHPHQVTIYAAGPLTNIALALSIDMDFAEFTKGIVIMGGALSPVTDDPELATHPRHDLISGSTQKLRTSSCERTGRASI